MNDLDRFSYDGSEPKVVASCAYCNEDIYEGDAATRYETDNITHADCEAGFLRSLIASYGVIDSDGNIA